MAHQVLQGRRKGQQLGWGCWCKVRQASGESTPTWHTPLAAGDYHPAEQAQHKADKASDRLSLKAALRAGDTAGASHNAQCVHHTCICCCCAPPGIPGGTGIPGCTGGIGMPAQRMGGQAGHDT